MFFSFKSLSSRCEKKVPNCFRYHNASDACCDYHLTRAEHHLVMTCQHVALGNRKQGDYFLRDVGLKSKSSLHACMSVMLDRQAYAVTSLLVRFSVMLLVVGTFFLHRDVGYKRICKAVVSDACSDN